MASAFGYTGIVMLLLKNKRSMNVTTYGGDTPLIYAARNNKMAIARELVEAGCDITIRNNENKTAVQVAKEEGHHAIEMYLRSIRFLPSADDESDEPRRAQGMAVRALQRDLLRTGLLPAGPLTTIKEFATG